jgi:hypothetical protein
MERLLDEVSSTRQRLDGKTVTIDAEYGTRPACRTEQRRRLGVALTFFNSLRFF